MAAQKDVEKFLQDNPAFAKEYFSKKLSPASISKVSGLSEKQIDFSQFQELSQVNLIISVIVYYGKKSMKRLLTKLSRK